MVAPPLALPPLAALPALPRHPQLHYPTHVGAVNVCLGFPRRSSITQFTWRLLMFALDLLHYPMHVGAVNVCLGFPPPLSNARGGC